MATLWPLLEVPRGPRAPRVAEVRKLWLIQTVHSRTLTKQARESLIWHQHAPTRRKQIDQNIKMASAIAQKSCVYAKTGAPTERRSFGKFARVPATS
eukprot:5251602-Pyramimonas_sp.AAC.1